MGIYVNDSAGDSVMLRGLDNGFKDEVRQKNPNLLSKKSSKINVVISSTSQNFRRS